jgi:hypothetical protein
MKILVLVLAAAALSGCQTAKVLQATGGSKSDGTVVLSYQAGAFEVPVIDWDLAQRNAVQRCVAWGYSNAQAFGGSTQNCLQYSGYSCSKTQFNYTYQCLDG